MPLVRPDKKEKEIKKSAKEVKEDIKEDIKTKKMLYGAGLDGFTEEYYDALIRAYKEKRLEIWGIEPIYYPSQGGTLEGEAIEQQIIKHIKELENTGADDDIRKAKTIQAQLEAYQNTNLLLAKPYYELTEEDKVYIMAGCHSIKKEKFVKPKRDPKTQKLLNEIKAEFGLMRFDPSSIDLTVYQDGDNYYFLLGNYVLYKGLEEKASRYRDIDAYLVNGIDKWLGTENELFKNGIKVADIYPGMWTLQDFSLVYETLMNEEVDGELVADIGNKIRSVINRLKVNSDWNNYFNEEGNKFIAVKPDWDRFGEEIMKRKRS